MFTACKMIEGWRVDYFKGGQGGMCGKNGKFGQLPSFFCAYTFTWHVSEAGMQLNMGNFV
jgi:hypothetical protein